MEELTKEKAPRSYVGLMLCSRVLEEFIGARTYVASLEHISILEAGRVANERLSTVYTCNSLRSGTARIRGCGNRKTRMKRAKTDS